MPIFGEKLKTAPSKGNWVPKLWSTCRDLVRKSVGISDFGRKISLNFGEDLFFFGDHLFLGGKNVRISDSGRKIGLNFGEDFFFWRSPVFGRKKRLNFRAFREISSQFLNKPCDSDSRRMKIRIKVVCSFFTLSKKPPPPFPNPGYAPAAEANSMGLGVIVPPAPLPSRRPCLSETSDWMRRD